MFRFAALNARAPRSAIKSRRLGMEELEVRTMLTGAPQVLDVQVSSTEWAPAFVDYLAQNGLGDRGYRIPTGSSVQSKPLPWSNLNVVSVKFSEDVNVESRDLSLTGVSIPHVSIAGFFYDAQNFVATWTLAAPLQKSNYQIDLDGSGIGAITDLSGNVLDGEWTHNADTFPSGNGTAGGDFQFKFTVMPGDVNQSASLGEKDYGKVTSELGMTTSSSSFPKFSDVNGSGAINSADLQFIWANWGGGPQVGGPSGAPVGAANDAPSAIAGGVANITNDAIDVAMSLWNAFQDNESADSQLTYQIFNVSNPSLFDSVSINSTTGNLVLNSASGQSGQSTIRVRATDQSGQQTDSYFQANVNYVNQRPVLEFWAESDEFDTWTIYCTVTDDGPVEGLYIHFVGPVFETRAYVEADGSVLFAVIVDPEDWDLESAYVVDSQGLSSFMEMFPFIIS